MKRINKRLLSLFICFTLLFGIVMPHYVEADDMITISLKRNPKIDIVVTANETTVDMTNFQTDLFAKLEEQGIDTTNIEVQTIAREEVSSDAVAASTIFNDWGRIGWPGQWSLTTVSNVQTIQNAENTTEMTGFYNPDAFDSTKIELTFNARSTNSDDDVLGCMFRFNVTDEGTSTKNKKCTTYLFLQNGGEGWPGGLYKLENYYFTGGGHGSASALTGYTASGSVGIKDPNFKKLAATSTKWTRNTWSSYKIICDKNNIKIYQNNTLLIDYTDTSSTPIESGSYGFFSWSQPYAQYQNFVAQTSNAKEFKDILLTPEWREDADHYIVNVDDIIDETFSNETTKGELLTRTINDHIRFVQWGTDTNKEMMEGFIQENNNNGIFFDNTDYSLAIKNTAEYIASFYETEEDNQLVVVNDPIDLEVTPANLATDTIDEEYPNGKWIIHHNAKYFANGTGQSEYSEQFQDDLNVVFDKPGEYTIYYGEDLVKTVYAHRLPIANFAMSLNEDKTLSLTNTSYDLDSEIDNYGLGKGIKEIKWQWKNMNDTTWQDGIPTVALSEGESYVVQLSVLDEQGAWSSPVAKYITLDETIEVPPVASFNFGTSTIFTNNELEILDSSYDPTGLDITTYEWILKKEKVVISTSATPTLSFNTTDLGVGTYYYTLRVQNSNGVWSESYTKSFTVIEDTVAPSVMINPTYSDWGRSSDINFEFMDSASGFAKFRYTHSDSQTPPSDSDTSWSEWSTNDNGALTIEEDGVWYLHLQAYDNNNNLLTRTVGVYRIDNVAPIITSVNVDNDSYKQEREINVGVSDNLCNLKYIQYRYINETTGSDSGYIENENPHIVTEEGNYKIYVKDQADNETFVENVVVGNIDRTSPSMTISTSTKDWSLSINASVVANDEYSGMNEYSYAIEKAKIALLNESNDVVYNSNCDIDVANYQWVNEPNFEISENGTYTLYARDVANNVTSATFVVNNIDKVAPIIDNISLSKEELTNGNIIITVNNARDESSGLAKRPYSYDKGNTWTSQNTFMISQNGSYEVLVKDLLGNIGTFEYTIGNIDKELPVLEELNVEVSDDATLMTIGLKGFDNREFIGYALTNSKVAPTDNAAYSQNAIFELTKSGTYYIHLKDVAGNVYSERFLVDSFVEGIDFTQDKKTQYQEITENGLNGGATTYRLMLLDDSLESKTGDGEYTTKVYVSQQSTFVVAVPKTIVLDGRNGVANFQTSVYGNIAGVEHLEVSAPDTFELKDVNKVKEDVIADVSLNQTSFSYDELLSEKVTDGNIQATFTAGSWKGIFDFIIELKNNQNTIDSIASVKEDSYGNVVDSEEIESIVPPIDLSVTNNNGTTLNTTYTSIFGENKDNLLNDLQETGMIEDSSEIDCLINVSVEEFTGEANVRIDVSDIANPGDVVVVYHYNETTSEWEYVTTEIVDEDGTIEATFTSFSPIALEVNEACDNCSISEWKVLKEATVYQHGQEQGVCSVCHKINEKVIAKLEPTQLTFNPIQELSSGSDTTTSSVTVRYNENARMVSTSKMGTCLSCKKTHAVYNMRCNICGSKSDYNVYQSTVPTGSYYQYSCSCGQIMQGSSIPKHTCIQTEKKYYTITFNANIEYPKNSNGENPTTAIGSNASKNVYYGSTNTTTTIPTWVGYETGKWLTTTTPTTSSRYLNSTYYRVAAHKGTLTVYANHTPYEYNVMLDFNTPNNEKVSINGKEISNTQLNVSNVLFDDYLDNLVVETEVIVDREYVASPTLKGYTFKGWSVNEDGSGTLLQANTRLNQSNLTNVFGSVPVNNSNLTLYAVWE